jgi:hypothetical protein
MEGIHYQSKIKQAYFNIFRDGWWFFSYNSNTVMLETGLDSCTIPKARKIPQMTK